MATLDLAVADQAALSRIRDAIDIEALTAVGFLAGFLEGLSDHLAGMVAPLTAVVAGAPGPCASPPE